MTSSSFFFLKPSEWKRNSSGSSGSSATASAAVSSALSGWYSQVSGAGLGEAHVDGPVDVDDLLGQHEWRRQVEAPERLQVTRSDFQQRVTVFLRRQVQRGVATDDVAGILGGLRAQRDPEGDVALGFTQRRQIQALAAEGEEDVTAAAFLADVDDQLDPLLVVMEQLEVLVDDDQQDRHRLEIAAGQPHLLVLVGVTRAGLFEKPVAPVRFRRRSLCASVRPGADRPCRGWTASPRRAASPARSWAADSNFMSTKITMNVSGECVSAIPLHSDRKYSDLPEPDVPITTE